MGKIAYHVDWWAEMPQADCNDRYLLQDYCRAKLGRLDSRIQTRSFEEVKAHNAAGQCWLILDGAPSCTMPP